MRVKIFSFSVMSIDDAEREINEFIKDKYVYKIIAREVSNNIVLLIFFS